MPHRICKTYRFEAAHHLEQWPEGHQCNRVHGHSYKVEVEIEGIPRASLSTMKPGAIEDFADVTRVWKEQIDSWVDHQDLNKVTKLPNTTAELLAEWIYYRMAAVLPNITRIRVWETDTAWAEYFTRRHS